MSGAEEAGMFRVSCLQTGTVGEGGGLQPLEGVCSRVCSWKGN